MSLYKQRGSKIWWYEFQFAGVRYRESAKTSSRSMAAEAERIRRRQVEEAFNGIKKREMPKTFSAALDELLAVKERTASPSYLEIMKRCGSHLRAAFGKTLLIDITAADVMEYKEKRRSPLISPRYINMDLQVMRAVLRRNGMWERIRPDFAMYRVDDEFGHELPKCDEPKLLHECARSMSRGLYTAVTLDLCTGMRSSEIKHLRWNEVFLDDDAYLIVGVSKTRAGRRRRVPLNARAIAALSDWARRFPNRMAGHYVFPAEKYSLGRNGGIPNVYRHDPTKPIGSLRVAWKLACVHAGIQMRFHDLRHTAVTRMLRAGIPLTTVAQIVGWSASTMYLMAKRYAHILQPEMRKAVAVLDAKATNSPTTSKSTAQSPAVSAKVKRSYDRYELYKRIWAVPMRTLAKEYGVSDVALAKACRKLKVPVPGRGYWAKKAAKLPVPDPPPLPSI